jgi:hypothetical protein
MGRLLALGARQLSEQSAVTGSVTYLPVSKADVANAMGIAVGRIYSHVRSA